MDIRYKGSKMMFFGFSISIFLLFKYGCLIKLRQSEKEKPDEIRLF